MTLLVKIRTALLSNAGIDDYLRQVALAGTFIVDLSLSQAFSHSRLWPHREGVN
jgi:hypothetical protein